MSWPDRCRHLRGPGRPIASGLLTLVVLFAAACGEDGESSTGSGGNGVDGAILAEMIPHHEAALEMAELARRRARHKKIKRLADAVIRSQKAEIDEMTDLAERLDAQGVENGDLGLPDHEMGMTGDMKDLESAKPFDRAFIDMMIPHHQGAIRMAHIELAKGESTEAKGLAEAIVQAQTREIDQMNTWRVDWYGKLSPAGGVPAQGHGMDDGAVEDMGH